MENVRRINSASRCMEAEVAGLTWRGRHIAWFPAPRPAASRRAGTCHDQGTCRRGTLIMTKMIVFRGWDTRVGRPKNEIGRPKNDASGVK